MLMETRRDVEERVAPWAKPGGDGGWSVVSKGVGGDVVDDLIYTFVFTGDADRKASLRRLIRALAAASGAWPASIHDLYMARGRRECGGFTVPAFNLRVMTYDKARAAFRAAREVKAGAFIFELARSEMGYTHQDPREYATCVLAAALRGGHEGPVFIQGDHFQVQPARFHKDRAQEIGALRTLIGEAIAADFLNIDIDASTMVDLSFPTLDEQQRLNYELTTELVSHVRSLQPAGVTISIGGEIGEVGGKNSTVEELAAYADGFTRAMAASSPGAAGISKISVQTGTSHGGVPLPDGRVAGVDLDFDVLEKLSRVARDRYGMAGAVQHGASTLPEEAFDGFPKVETAEIHLATGFQLMLFDHPAFPDDLLRDVDAYL
jgi:fructose/tagatose bisphosphate aldolase